MYCGNYGLPKTWLDQCLKSPVLEYPWKSNMANGSKHCSHLKTAPLPYLLITGNSIVLQRVSISDMTKSQNCFLRHRVPMASILS